jgi:hypothetical protein
MKGKEADKFGIDRDDRYSYVALSMHTESRKYQVPRLDPLVILALPPLNRHRNAADDVGIVTSFTPPAPADGVTAEDILEIQARVGDVPFHRADSQAAM